MSTNPISPDPEVYRALAELQDRGEFSKLAVLAAKEVQRAPEDRRLVGFLVSGLMHSDSLPGAIAALHEVLNRDPDDDLALLGLALARERKDKADSQRLFQRLFDRGSAHVFQGPEGIAKMSPVVDIERWCETHGSVVLEPARDVTVFDPAVGAEGHYRSDTIFSTIVPFGTMVADWDFVITSAGEVLNGSGFQDISMSYRCLRHIADDKLQQVIHPWSAEYVDVDEDALFLSAPPSSFGHWISDFLPRMKAWQRPLKIATTISLDQHQCDTLSLFGVQESDVIWCKSATRYRFRNLTVVRTGSMYRPNPDVTRFLHSKLGPDPATRPKKYAMGRRFFLERSGTTRGRYITNPDDLRPLLDELGFESIRRPEIPVMRQNEMFQDAGIVLAVFGTDALTLYQLRPGTDLVLIHPSFVNESGADTFTIVLASLCAAVGVRLHSVRCTATHKAGIKSIYHQDIIVDPDTLRDCLYGIIERRSLECAAG